jgi:hypothetical protein
VGLDPLGLPLPDSCGQLGADRPEYGFSVLLARKPGFSPKPAEADVAVLGGLRQPPALSPPQRVLPSPRRRHQDRNGNSQDDPPDAARSARAVPSASVTKLDEGHRHMLACSPVARIGGHADLAVVNYSLRSRPLSCADGPGTAWAGDPP